MRYIEGFQNRAIETSSSLVVENCFFSDLIHGGFILKNNGITVNLSLSCFIDVINDDFGACLASKFPIHNIKTYFDKIIFRCCFTYPKEKETTEGQTVSIRCNQGENILLMAFISTSHCGLNNDSYDRRGIVDLAGINSQLSNINMTDASENSQSLYCGSELHGATLNAKFMTMTRLFSKASMFIINSNSSFLNCNIYKLNCTKYPICCTESTASFIKCCIINNYNQQVSAKKSTIIIDSCYIVNVSFPEPDKNPQNSYSEIDYHIKIGSVMEVLMKKPTTRYNSNVILISFLKLFLKFGSVWCWAFSSLQLTLDWITK